MLLILIPRRVERFCLMQYSDFEIFTSQFCITLIFDVMLLLQIRIGCFIAKYCKFSLPFQYWQIFSKFLYQYQTKLVYFMKYV
jgi:hypothetical protein